MFLDLTGKGAIVTGAAQGIGLAIAERLARAGARVAIVDRNEAAAQQAAQQITAAGGQAVAVHTDLTQPQDIDAMVSRTLESFGQIDILVNNAGIAGRAAPIWDASDSDWDQVMALNLTAVFACCRAVIRPMRERQSGAIVNIASIDRKSVV